MDRRRKILLVGLLLAMLLSGCGQTARQEFDPAGLERDTTRLCREFQSPITGTPEERLVCDWLEEQLLQAGFRPEEGSLERSGFRGLGELESENLMAVCNPGSPGPILCVTAHYDVAPGTVGARDNAASVAILLQLARCLGPGQPELEGEIRLLFLGSEENGYHGSRAYLEGLSREELERHEGVFNMDISAASPGEGSLVCCTLGGRGPEGYQEGNFLEPRENTVTRALARAYESLYGTRLPVLHGGESDHVSFHQWGLDAANVCWRREDGGMPLLPPEYHRQEDVPETLDYQTAAMTGRCILWALRDLLGGISTQRS